MQEIVVTHQISEAEASQPGAEVVAAQAAFRDAVRQARAAVGNDLPQDHSIVEASRPDGLGGLIVECRITLP